RDWSSDVCSSDLDEPDRAPRGRGPAPRRPHGAVSRGGAHRELPAGERPAPGAARGSGRGHGRRGVRDARRGAVPARRVRRRPHDRVRLDAVAQRVRRGPRAGRTRGCGRLATPEGARSARRNGFTLIELLVVVAMVGILTGLAIPNMRTVVVRARAADVAADLDVVRVATLQYSADAHVWPAESSAGVTPADVVDYLPV